MTGSTLAFFTDTETTEANTFTAGVIDITVTEDNTTIVSGTIEDLKPCMTGYKIVRITATPESNPMELWKKLNSLADTDRLENTVVEPELAYYNANGITNPPGKNDLDRYMHFDMWIESDPDSTPETVTYDAGDDTYIIPESEGWLVTSNDNTTETALFTPAVIDDTDNGVTGNYIYLGQIEPGETMVIVQSFHMDASVGNWAQSDSVSFTEEIVAQQIEGSTLPPVPGTVLTGHDRP